MEGTFRKSISNEQLNGYLWIGGWACLISAALTFCAGFFYGILLVNHTTTFPYPSYGHDHVPTDKQIIKMIKWEYEARSETITSFVLFFCAYGLLTPIGQAIRQEMSSHPGLATYAGFLLNTAAISGSIATFIQLAAKLAITEGYRRFSPIIDENNTNTSYLPFSIWFAGETVSWAGEYTQLLYHFAFLFACLIIAFSDLSHISRNWSYVCKFVSLLNATGQLSLAITIISYRFHESREALGVLYILVQSGTYPLWLIVFGMSFFIRHAVNSD